MVFVYEPVSNRSKERIFDPVRSSGSFCFELFTPQTAHVFGAVFEPKPVQNRSKGRNFVPVHNPGTKSLIQDIFNNTLLEKLDLTTRDDVANDLQRHRIRKGNDAIKTILETSKATINPFDASLDKKKSF